MRRKIFSAMVCLGMLGLPMASWAQGKHSIAPLKPVSGVPSKFGLLEAPIDMSHLVPEITILDTPPSSWDWRNLAHLGVTPVKDQNPYGSCWAFAATGSIESQALLDEAVTYDFAEMEPIKCNHSGLTCDSGGNDWYASFYYSLHGMSQESCNPYVSCSSATCSNCLWVKQLMEWQYVCDSANTAAIKDALYHIGPVSTSMYASGSGFSTYDGSYVIYNSSSPTTDHAVLIVGYDDNMPHAGGTGAWIVKNSWGTSWGDQGYFYIAYGSWSIGTASSVYSGYRNYPANQVIMTYENDVPFSAVGYDGDQHDWGAVRFTPTLTGNLTHVGFWTWTTGTSYTIKIFDNWNNGSPTVQKNTTQSGTLTRAGYYTLELTSPVPVTNADEIVIIIELTTPGYNWPIVIDSIPPLETNKSFISDTGADGTWEAVDNGSWGAGDVAFRAYNIVSVAVPVIGRSPSTMSFQALPGQAAPNQTLNIWNAGVGTLNYTITDDRTWLSASPASGTATTETDPITISATCVGMSAGTYNGTVTITAPAANNSPQTVAVSLSCSAPETAVYSPSFTAPQCNTGISPCIVPAALINGRDTMSGGNEPHQPNTLAASVCADGTGGSYHVDESLDSFIVNDLSGAQFQPGNTVRVDATVWCYTSGSTDSLYVYRSNSATSPSWLYMGTAACPAAGVQTLSVTFILGPTAGNQAIRAAYTYNSPAASCDSGGYNDRDDVVLAVISPSPCNLTSLDIIPVISLPGGNINLAEGAQQTFTAACTYTGGSCGVLSDNCTQAGGVNWNCGGQVGLSTLGPSISTIATAGQILGPNGGAGQVSGSATYGAGTFSDSTNITVTNNDTVSSIDVIPVAGVGGTITLAEGTAQGFRATATWSDTSTSNETCSAATVWSKTGDVTLGACAAGSQALTANQIPCGPGGAGTVTATNNTRADTTNITVTNNDTLSSVDLTPNGPIMKNMGSTQDFSCLGTWSDACTNSEANPKGTVPSYSLPPGTCTTNGTVASTTGLYTAGTGSTACIEAPVCTISGMSDSETVNVVCPGDNDCDGLPNTWEQTYACMQVNTPDANLDYDSDGLNNANEYAEGTDPCDPDSDNDGANDGLEVGLSLDPLDPDTDNDLMNDGAEIFWMPCLDPLVGDALFDSDSDGLINIHELYNSSNPCDDFYPRLGKAGGGYFGDGDGNLSIGVPDLDMIAQKLSGDIPDYSNVQPASELVQDLDGNLSIGVPDLDILAAILSVAQDDYVPGTPNTLAQLLPSGIPSVAIGNTVGIKVKLSIDGSSPRPGFGVVFNVVSGSAALYGGEGVPVSGYPAGARYDITNLDGEARMTLKVNAAGTIKVQVQLPYDAGVHTMEVTLTPEVQIN